MMRRLCAEDLSASILPSWRLGDKRWDWPELAIQFLFEGALFRRGRSSKCVRAVDRINRILKLRRPKHPAKPAFQVSPGNLSLRSLCSLRLMENKFNHRERRAHKETRNHGFPFWVQSQRQARRLSCCMDPPPSSLGQHRQTASARIVAAKG